MTEVAQNGNLRISVSLDAGFTKGVSWDRKFANFPLSFLKQLVATSCGVLSSSLAKTGISSSGLHNPPRRNQKSWGNMVWTCKSKLELKHSWDTSGILIHWASSTYAGMKLTFTPWSSKSHISTKTWGKIALQVKGDYFFSPHMKLKLWCYCHSSDKINKAQYKPLFFVKPALSLYHTAYVFLCGMHNHILQTVILRMPSVASYAEQSSQWGFDALGKDGVVEHGKGILQS